MHKFITKGTLVFVACVFLFSCRQFFIPNDEKITFEIKYTISPDLGTKGTEFIIKVDSLLIKNDMINNFDRYKFRWDYNSDGKFDTEWMEDAYTNYIFSTIGKQQTIVEIKTPGLDVFNDTCIIYIQPLVRITDNTTGYAQGSADWALDGSNRIAYDSPSDSILSNQSCDHVIWIVDYPNGTPKQVSMNCAYFPEWSHDGRYILFRRGQEFWLADLILNKERFLFKNDGIIPFIPSWSYNNIKLIYTTINSIAIYHISTGIVLTIPTDITYNLVSWAPGDNLIAVATRNNELSVIDIIDVKEEKLVTSYRLGFNYAGAKLDWSSNHKWLSIGFANGDNNLYIIDLDSGNFKQIQINGLENTWYASWSHDSKMLIFEARVPGENISIWGIEIPEEF